MARRSASSFDLRSSRFDRLALADVDQQPLALGGERALLVLLQRHIAERPEDAGQAAVRIALGMRAVFDVHDAAVLRDHARFAIHFIARAGAARARPGCRRDLPDGSATGRAGHADPRACSRAPTLRPLVAESITIWSARFDAGMEREVGRQLADQAMKTFALAQPRLLDQQALARSIQVAAQPRHHAADDRNRQRADLQVDAARAGIEGGGDRGDGERC